MVSAPVKSAPVNDPKNEGMPGAKVRIRAALKSGTIIIPPGMRSIVRLMGTCMRAVLPEDGKDAPIRRALQEMSGSCAGVLARASGRAGTARSEDRAEIGVLASVGSGLGADVGDLDGVGLEPRLGDYEGAREREGLGLLGAQLAERVGGAEILLLASGTVERDVRAFGGLETGGVAGGAGRAGEHPSGHH